MTPIRKYRMLVQARTDLTPAEIERYVNSSTGKGGARPQYLPWRETGDIIHARRRNAACAFYRALKQIKPIIKIRAVRIPYEPKLERHDDVAMRAWRGFECLCGYVAHAGVEASDEAKHFPVADGTSACGIKFTAHWKQNGKPDCDKCLAAAVEEHPEMKQYL